MWHVNARKQCKLRESGQCRRSDFTKLCKEGLIEGSPGRASREGRLSSISTSHVPVYRVRHKGPVDLKAFF